MLKTFRLRLLKSVAFNEEPSILQRIKDIKNLGISIAIDDFGTGYSSFTRLKTFPIDLIKIDIDFVRGISSKYPKEFLCWLVFPSNCFPLPRHHS